MNIIFTTKSYGHLKTIKPIRINQSPTLPDYGIGSNKFLIFPDGELYQKIDTQISGHDVFIVGGTISDSETLELFDLACGAVQYGAKSLTLVIPYYGYSTMERAVKPGEIVKAKTRAILLSAIPHAPNGNKIIFIDLHSEGIPHYFNENVRTVHLYCKDIVRDAAIELYGTDFVLATTDAGRAKWVESLANDMGVNAAFIFKRRISGSETKVTSISADVAGKNVIIYDDMIRTGGSLIGAAEAYHNAGAKEISVIATHGLFTGDALFKLSQSKIKQIVCTDTHPNALNYDAPFLKVKSVAELISNNI